MILELSNLSRCFNTWFKKKKMCLLANLSFVLNPVAQEYPCGSLCPLSVGKRNASGIQMMARSSTRSWGLVVDSGTTPSSCLPLRQTWKSIVGNCGSCSSACGIPKGGWSDLFSTSGIYPARGLQRRVRYTYRVEETLKVADLKLEFPPAVPLMTRRHSQSLV